MRTSLTRLSRLESLSFVFGYGCMHWSTFAKLWIKKSTSIIQPFKKNGPRVTLNAEISSAAYIGIRAEGWDLNTRDREAVFVQVRAEVGDCDNVGTVKQSM